MRIIKLIFFLALAFPGLVCAQAPQKMSYQSVVRDASNMLVTSSTVGIRISVMQGSIFGPSMYVETHSVLTNANGLATLEIGGGTVLLGTFSSIDWSNGPYFIKTETDPTGGTNYSISATSELLSVPYALYAKTAESLSSQQSPVFLYLEKKASIQSVPNATIVTVVNYDSISTSGFTVTNNTGEITFLQGGVYVLTAQTSFDASNQGRKLVWFDCVSANYPARIASNEQSGNANRITTSFVGRFNAGDKLKLVVEQFTGVTVDCPSNTLPFDETLIAIERLR